MYTIIKEIPLDLETVVKRLPMELQKKGFDILSTHNLGEEFRSSLGVEFCDYYVISVCCLPLAYRALMNEMKVGLFLPINIVLYQRGNMTVVGTIRPMAFMPVIDDQQLLLGASALERKLGEVLGSISKKRFLRQKPREVYHEEYERAVA